MRLTLRNHAPLDFEEVASRADLAGFPGVSRARVMPIVNHLK